MSAPLLVSGATGKIGSGVVRALAAGGVRVRALVRDPARARALLGDDVELAVADLADCDALAGALEGVGRVLVVPPDRRVELAERLVEAAAAAGVPSVVRISAMGLDAGAESEILRAHAAGEAHLAATGLRATNVRCNSFLQNLEWFGPLVARDGAFFSCGGHAAVAWVDVADIVAVAAALMRAPSLPDAPLDVTGPRGLTAPQLASAMSEALGRAVRYVDLSAEDFPPAAIAAGWDDWIAHEWAAMYAGAYYGSGKAGVLSGTVQACTGRPPRTVEDYLRGIADRFTAARVPAWVRGHGEAEDAA